MSQDANYQDLEGYSFLEGILTKGSFAENSELDFF